MRELSLNEREVVRQIVEWEYLLIEQPQNYTRNSIDNLLKQVLAKFNAQLNISISSGFNPYIEVVTGIAGNNSHANIIATKEVLEVINFITYLADERFIYLVNPNVDQHPYFNITLGSIVGSNNRCSSKINDKGIIDTFKSFHAQDIYPSQTLINYYNNGFNTPEQRLEKIKKFTFIGAAVLAVIIITLVSININQTQKVLSKPYRLDEYQLRMLHDKMNTMDSILLYQKNLLQTSKKSLKKRSSSSSSSSSKRTNRAPGGVQNYSKQQLLEKLRKRY